MKIEQWPIGRPKPYSKNPRKILDVAVQRWQDFTGAKARLEDGGTFESVSRSRTRRGKKTKAA